MIDKYKLVVNRFTAELSEPLDRTLRTLVTAEVEIYEVASQDKQDGNFDEVYKSKLVGSTIVKQGEKKPILAKSKRSQSQKLRQAIWHENPDEDYYDVIMEKLVANIPEVIQFLKDK